MFDEKLIALVRQYAVLFDMSNPRYLDHKYKMKVWTRIGIILNMPALECKNRWGNIRDQFRRNLGKKPRSGQAAEKLKPYKYAKLLQFLLPHLSERDTMFNIPKRKVVTQTEVAQAVVPQAVVLQVVVPQAVVPQVVVPQAVVLQVVVPQAVVPQVVVPQVVVPQAVVPQVVVPQAVVPQVEVQHIEVPQNNTSVVRVEFETANNNGQTEEPVASPPQKMRAGTKKRTKSTSENDQTPATVLMEYILRKNDERDVPQHPMFTFLKSMGEILINLSPRAQHTARGRIFSIVHEMEYEALQEASREQQQPVSSWVPPHIYDGPSTSQGFSPANIPHDNSEVEHQNRDYEADNPQ